MNRITGFMAAASTVAALFASCTSVQTVTVTNDTDLARSNETIEIELSALKGIQAENAVVLSGERQIPSQVYTEKDGTAKLLFQASVPAQSSIEFTVAKGIREEFETKAYSRYVPERLDDYAYENNLVAGRVYGPALNDPRTFGSDIWLKCTSRLIIDEWFEKADYHHNYGEGMDCYKVASTLGGGALVPCFGGKLYIGDNYQTQEHICDGPIRTKAYLTYSFDMDGKQIDAVRELSLDANSRFVKISTCFNADCETLPVALGAIQHNVIAREDGRNYIAFTEEASDTDDPARDGNISVGLVLDNAVEALGTSTIDGHAVILANAVCGTPVAAWTGSGWSQGGIESPEAWAQAVKDFAFAQANPLKVTIK
ncbi:MAG: DUF4861 domain-containing protein [Bacteroidales bacterium]|nr:DUF4861 domain-containing protein [Bacteroidales bacterium]